MKANLKFWSNTTVAVIFLSALLVSGCRGDKEDERNYQNAVSETKGSARVVVNANIAKSKAPGKLGVEQADVTSMTMTASLSTGDVKVDCNQSGAGAPYSCVMNLPTGVDITLSLSAFPANQTTAPIYTGSAVINLTAGQNLKVTINMQAAGSQTSSIPVILSVTTPPQAAIGQAAAIDVDVADGDATLLTVSFASSNGGVFTPASVEVTPPATDSVIASTSFSASDLGTGGYIDTITVTVTDGADFTVEQNISLPVEPVIQPLLTANLPPEISSIAVVELGADVTLTAQVTDDQDVSGLTYGWTVSGTAAGTTNPLTITKPADGSEIVVTVTDTLGAARSYTLLWGGVLTPPADLTVCGFGCDHTTIQGAIAATKPGQGVLVKDGMYVENLSITKRVSLKSQNGPGVTIIDGKNANVVTVSGPDAALTMDGFKVVNGLNGVSVITNGSAEIMNSTVTSNRSSGVYASGSALLKVTNSTISGNSAYYGGGIHVNGSTVTVTGSTISGNTAQYGGGGIYTYASTVTVTGSIISDNTHISNYGGNGGGIYANQASVLTVNKSVIAGNFADSNGAGIFATGSGTSLTLTNNLIANNTASKIGGAIYFTNYSTGDLLHNTIVNNTATVNGGGIYVTGSAAPRAYNNILWGNKVGVNPVQIEVAANNFITIVYSDIQGGYSGTGNIDADPLFAASDPEFNITQGSPAIDAGTGQVTGVPQLPVDDHAGEARPDGAGYDMGWDEFIPPVVP